MAAPKRSRLEELPDTCGSCRHGIDVSGEEYLLCMVDPPIPVCAPDGEITWHRGGPVEPTDPACGVFSPKGRA